MSQEINNIDIQEVLKNYHEVDHDSNIYYDDDPEKYSCENDDYYSVRFRGHNYEINKLTDFLG